MPDSCYIVCTNTKGTKVVFLFTGLNYGPTTTHKKDGVIMNSIVRSIMITVVILFSIGAYAGCVGTKSVDVKPLEYADFLSDYSKLSPVAGEKEMKRYINPNADFAKYDKILIDRIKV